MGVILTERLISKPHFANEENSSLCFFSIPHSLLGKISTKVTIF